MAQIAVRDYSDVCVRVAGLEADRSSDQFTAPAPAGEYTPAPPKTQV